MRKNKTSPAKARRLQMQQQAVDFRRAGLGFVDIGSRLGVSKSTAHRLIQEGLADAKEQILASVDELRADEILRLDGMLLKLYPKAADGDLLAIDRVIKIGERRARLLGLDAPIRTALQGGGDDAPPLSTVTQAKVTFYMPDNGRG